MFSIEDRDRVRDFVLRLAKSDARVVAAAIVGSLAHADGDRFSDLDLTFGVRDDAVVSEVAADWTRRLAAELDASTLFDLPFGSTIYRVFLLPGSLQVDLSFTPAADFGALTPEFRLLFGNAVERPHVPPPSAAELFGYAVHHAVRARFSVERGRLWQAEYWLSAARDYTLSLACRRRDLPARYGRGFDRLPADALDRFKATFVTSLERDQLLGALQTLVRAIAAEAAGLPEFSTPMADRLRELVR